MSEASKHQRLLEVRQDCELAIRKLRACCDEADYDFTAYLIDAVFSATDREVCLQKYDEVK